MDRRLKTKLLTAVIVFGIAESVILLWIFLRVTVFTVDTWYLVVGISAVIAAGFFIYTCPFLPYVVNRKFLKASMAMNPGLTMFFAGLFFITQYLRYEDFSMIWGMVAILCLLISVVLLVLHFKSEERQA